MEQEQHDFNAQRELAHPSIQDVINTNPPEEDILNIDASVMEDTPQKDKEGYQESDDDLYA